MSSEVTLSPYKFATIYQETKMWAGGLAQVVEGLSNKHKALHSNSWPMKKRKRN
jgi:hypothetical protein